MKELISVPSLTQEELNKIPEEIRVSLENVVYKATSIFEELEGLGKIWGNSHHIRQGIARFAVRMCASRWKDDGTIHMERIDASE